MGEKAQAIIELLIDNEIKFDIINHNAIYTIDEMQSLNLPNSTYIAKNLFIRDDRKHNYFLVVIRMEKKLDLKALRVLIDSRPLSFASENDLNTILGIPKGSVTPFGVLNDDKRKVKIIFDNEFQASIIGIHPNDNTATVFLKTSDLVSLLKQHGNSVSFVTL